MKRTILILAVLLLGYAPCGICEEKMLFFTGGISPPLVFEKNGRIVGMDVDTVSEFCKYQQITPEFKAYPLKRALEMMKTPDAQGIFTIFRTPEREEFLQFPETPINTVTTVIIGLKGSNVKIGKMDDLKNIKLGVIHGHKYGPLFDNYQGLNKYPVRDKSVLIRLLAAGDRVDAIINSEAVFEYECMEFGYDINRFEKLYTVAENPVYIGFSKKALGDERAAELAEKFSEFMKEIAGNGKLKNMREKYEGQPSY
ncbi:MAG: transporter substrate-binding domain-containing protein [Proteobacteria bacterium]|nr:transporter substrate-binding domain-containing protein [Pseudomonadota bacterium]MBU0968734.1 transporter substrate-binding domain-containing protein [Pseudomonadota bacterium]